MKPPSRARKIVDWILGSALVLLGIAGVLLPVLPGVIFIVAGLAVLSSHSELVRRIHEGWKARARTVRDRVLKRD